ncbi:MAG: hypothetical protein JRG89_22600 [Deltaproteobacteria bacterium]|nr:hypothetical protein [Deltaproteobacteria bacterium]
MNRLSTTIMTMAAAIAIATAGCNDGGNGGGSGGAESGVQIGAASSELTPPAAAAAGGGPALATVSEEEVPESGFPATDADGTTFHIDMARGYLRDIELDLADGEMCDQFEEGMFSEPVSCAPGDDKIVISGPFMVDLVNAISEPDLKNVGIPGGLYQRIDVRFDDAEVADGLVTVDDPLNENTLIMSGTFKFDPEDAGEVEKTFEMALKFNEDVRFEGPAEDIVLDDSDAEDLVLRLDVAMWFNALPITTCIDDGDLVVDDDNHLVIADSGNCSTVENDLKEAMKTSGQLDKD